MDGVDGLTIEKNRMVTKELEGILHSKKQDEMEDAASRQMEALAQETTVMQQTVQNGLQTLPVTGEQQNPQVQALPGQQQVKEGYFDRKNRREKEETRYNSYKAMKTAVTADFEQTEHMQNVLQKTTKYKDGDHKVSIKQTELRDKVRAGDYSHLEQLDPVLRELEAVNYMNAHMQDLSGTPAEVVTRLRQGGINGLMQPLLRIGISMGMRGLLPNNPAIPGNMDAKEFFRSLDAEINKEIMVETIVKPSGQQLFMAKLMLLTQLGGVRKTVTKNGKKDVTNWEGPLANAYAHCSRVGVILPGDSQASSQGDSETVLDTFVGKKKDGFFKRGAATHSLQKKSKLRGGKEFKEKKTKGTFSNQWGMNVAVGGLGNQGIPGPGDRTLKNDGSCGHIYMHLQEGDETTYTSLLIGFESDSYKKTNQLGHTHGFGNGEFASSFGGQRMDEIGDKYGGRVVDLSGMSEDVYKNAVHNLQEHFRNASQEPDKIEEIVRKLCGEQMSLNEIQDLLRLG